MYAGLNQLTGELMAVKALELVGRSGSAEAAAQLAELVQVGVAGQWEQWAEMQVSGDLPAISCITLQMRDRDRAVDGRAVRMSQLHRQCTCCALVHVDGAGTKIALPPTSGRQLAQHTITSRRER